MYPFYADDTVILVETPYDLRYALNEFHLYCELWKVKVNTNKTKYLYFVKSQWEFVLKNAIIENVKDLKYLGIGFFHFQILLTKQNLFMWVGTDAMYGAIRKNKAV